MCTGCHGQVAGRGVVLYKRNAQCEGKVMSEHLRYNITDRSKISLCYYGGSLDSDGMCSCLRGFMGNDCSTPMRDCHHGFYEGGFQEHGVYWILPSMATHPFPVYCHMKGSKTRTYITSRFENTFTVDFNRRWEDYRAGFGDPSGDFWHGLDNIHVLTSSGDYTIRFLARRLSPDQNLMQQYDHFRVLSGDDLYRVTFDASSTTGNLGDSFSPSNGANFSTPDNYDNVDVNCAARHKAGWWFRDEECSLCNPTGPLLRPENGKVSGILDEVFWTFDLGDTAPHKVSANLMNFD